MVSGCILLASESNGTTQAIVVRDDTCVANSQWKGLTANKAPNLSFEHNNWHQCGTAEGAAGGGYCFWPRAPQKPVSGEGILVFSQQCSVFNRIQKSDKFSTTKCFHICFLVWTCFHSRHWLAFIRADVLQCDLGTIDATDFGTKTSTTSFSPPVYSLKIWIQYSIMIHVYRALYLFYSL